jgi:hypothetical protein
MVGRFGYSDLKEAALSGAAAYGSWMEFSWSGGQAARLWVAAEQAESRAEVCWIRFGCSVEERACAFAAGERNLRRGRGGHAVAWLWFEVGVE